MLKKDAIEYFGSAAKLARALNISQVAVCKWGDTVPKLRRYEINDIMMADLKHGQKVS